MKVKSILPYSCPLQASYIAESRFLSVDFIGLLIFTGINRMIETV